MKAKTHTGKAANKLTGSRPHQSSDPKVPALILSCFLNFSQLQRAASCTFMFNPGLAFLSPIATRLILLLLPRTYAL